MNLRELKKYPMAEAIYFRVFGVSEEDLNNKPKEEIIADYAHLEKNVEETLETITEREQLILRRVLNDKRSLRQVGEELAMSSTRVSQILDRSFRRLSHPSRTRRLNGTYRRMEAEAEIEQKHY